jgi:protein CrcB
MLKILPLSAWAGLSVPSSGTSLPAGCTRWPELQSFPVGTMTVNITGCLLIGIGGGLMESRQLFSPELRAFLFVGILGSFTTFSTFGLETFNLAKAGPVAGFFR